MEENEASMSHRTFQRLIEFSLLAMAASREASVDALRPILSMLCDLLHVDRMAIASIRKGRARLLVGVGDHLPGFEDTISDLSSDALALLDQHEAVPIPTEGVGWDYILAIRAGVSGQLRACLLVDDTTQAREFNPEQRHSLHLTSRLLSEVSRYDLEYRAVQNMAIEDGLTGLGTRRYLEQRLEEIRAHAVRRGVSFWVVMADVDFFKRVNDQHGHPVGDNVLKQFANTLKLTVRSDEICGRMGGEEFLICGYGTLSDGYIVAQRVRVYVAQHSGEWPGCVPITASFGVAVFDAERHTSVAELLEEADRALYSAKQGGRDTVRPSREEQSL